MNSTFDDEFAELALPDLLAEFGVTVTHATDAGVETELTAILGPERSEAETDAPDGRRRLVRRDVTITTDPTSEHGGVANPVESDAITINGEVWPVETITLAGGAAKLGCLRSPTVKKSRPGYYKRN